MSSGVAHGLSSSKARSPERRVSGLKGVSLKSQESAGEEGLWLLYGLISIGVPVEVSEFNRRREWDSG